MSSKQTERFMREELGNGHEVTLCDWRAFIQNSCRQIKLSVQSFDRNHDRKILYLFRLSYLDVNLPSQHLTQAS